MPHRTPKDNAWAISTSKQGKCCKRLELHLQRGAFSLKQLLRKGNVAIYSQVCRGYSEPSIAFEVICVRRHNGKEIKGQRVEASEFYPSGSEWGKYGFTFNNRNTALRKFRELSRQATGSRKQ
jgi:hypothetical protein